jgi:hypothetical protein
MMTAMTDNVREARLAQLRTRCSGRCLDVAARLLDELVASGGRVSDDDELRRRLCTTRTVLARLRHLAAPVIAYDNGDWVLAERGREGAGDMRHAQADDAPHSSARTRAALDRERLRTAVRRLGAAGLDEHGARKVLMELTAYAGTREVVATLERLSGDPDREDTPLDLAALTRSLCRTPPDKPPTGSAAWTERNIWRADAPFSPENSCLLVARDERNSPRVRRAREQLRRARAPRWDGNPERSSAPGDGSFIGR